MILFRAPARTPRQPSRLQVPGDAAGRRLTSRVLAGCAVACLTGRGSALNFVAQGPDDRGEVSELTEPRTFRHVLDNDEDLQYMGNMTVGGQNIQGIFDTGSIEFAVLSDKFTKYCGTQIENLYHANSSQKYRHGDLSLVLSYGSGTLMAKEAYDTVVIGTMQASVSPFWEVTDADMPLLLESNFEAIVGLGPVPKDVLVLRPDHGQMRVESHMYAVLQKRMMIQRFSICLGKQPRSNG